LIICTTYN